MRYGRLSLLTLGSSVVRTVEYFNAEARVDWNVYAILLKELQQVIKCQVWSAFVPPQELRQCG